MNNIAGLVLTYVITIQPGFVFVVIDTRLFIHEIIYGKHLHEETPGEPVFIEQESKYRSALKADLCIVSILAYEYAHSFVMKITILTLYIPNAYMQWYIMKNMILNVLIKKYSG